MGSTWMAVISQAWPTVFDIVAIFTLSAWHHHVQHSRRADALRLRIQRRNPPGVGTPPAVEVPLGDGDRVAVLRRVIDDVEAGHAGFFFGSVTKKVVQAFQTSAFVSFSVAYGLPSRSNPFISQGA